MKQQQGRKFSLGRVVSTPAAFDALVKAGHSPGRFLLRHALGDWGDVCAEDQRANDQALADGTRLLSSYTLRDGTQIWIITEADRSATTILLPGDY